MITRVAMPLLPILLLPLLALALPVLFVLAWIEDAVCGRAAAQAKDGGR
jgi:hypothetical protein